MIERSAALEALFAPHRVAVFTARLDDVAHELEAPDLALRDVEAAAIADAVPARRLEFAVGRHCARAALEALGGPAVAIPRAEDRSPVWPPGWPGSITHSRLMCAAVAVPEGVEVRSVGLDLEQAERLSSRVERRILTDPERRRLGSATGVDRRDRVAATFAAKEAFYKAQYQLTRRWLPFSAVHVHVDDEALRFENGDGSADAAIVDATVGRWALVGGHVAAGVTIAL